MNYHAGDGKSFRLKVFLKPAPPTSGEAVGHRAPREEPLENDGGQSGQRPRLSRLRREAFIFGGTARKGAIGGEFSASISSSSLPR
jgi:hypothetical protein